MVCHACAARDRESSKFKDGNIDGLKFHVDLIPEAVQLLEEREVDGG